MLSVNNDPECCADCSLYVQIICISFSTLYFNDDKSFAIKLRLSGTYTLPYLVKACRHLTHDGARGCEHVTAGVSFLSSSFPLRFIFLSDTIQLLLCQGKQSVAEAVSGIRTMSAESGPDIVQSPPFTQQEIVRVR